MLLALLAVQALSASLGISPEADARLNEARHSYLLCLVAEAKHLDTHKNDPASITATEMLVQASCEADFQEYKAASISDESPTDKDLAAYVADTTRPSLAVAALQIERAQFEKSQRKNKR